MKILLISGHGNGDSGAVGNGYTEEALNIEFVLQLKEYLQSTFDVDVYDTSKNAYEDYVNGEFTVDSDYGYALEIHFNAFDGSASGSEIYVTSLESGITVEQGIMSNLKSYFTLRDNDSIFDGVKYYNYSVIYALKYLGISSALLEVCFIDSSSDITIYQNNKLNIIQDVATAIIEGFGMDTVEALLSTDEIASEVIAGLWSNGTERKTLLEAAGYNYSEVQSRVNELLDTSSNSLSIDEIANEVILGIWSNGTERKTLLEAAGYDYDLVQARVNEILK